jgi:glucose/arabinose dehydrogenase
LVIWAALASTGAAVEPALKVAAGFVVERVYDVPRESQGSWISLAVDPRGVLYASDQDGPLYRIRLAEAAGEIVEVRPLKLPIGGAHGLTWIGDELYAVAGQQNVCATGLYRLRDTDGDRELDALQQLQALAGDGEHGPHAVAASRDGKSLLVLAGNATRLPKLARSLVPELWRNDSLLAPLPALVGSETRGLAHGGWICRTDRDAREWELVCLGLRNAYALACDESGEIFTVDSDTEFEIGLPWYRPNRVLHCVSGADFGWRSGAVKIHENALDTLPPLLSLGAGSPTAVVFGTGAAFPARYRKAMFVADWSFGRLLAVHLRGSGAGFEGVAEEIVSGTPLPIAAACVNPRDGQLYFVTGGRKVQSHLYRLAWRGAGPVKP